jgi:hypothetical protein
MVEESITGVAGETTGDNRRNKQEQSTEVSTRHELCLTAAPKAAHEDTGDNRRNKRQRPVKKVNAYDGRARTSRQDVAETYF